MLSRLLKEHQAKQNERKELQGMCFCTLDLYRLAPTGPFYIIIKMQR